MKIVRLFSDWRETHFCCNRDASAAASSKFRKVLNVAQRPRLRAFLNFFSPRSTHRDFATKAVSRQALFILLLAFGRFVAAEDSSRFLSHLLGYIALDYSAAVEKKGKVVNAAEYSEMKEFVASAIKESSQIPAVSKDKEFGYKLLSLKKLITEKAAPDEVTKAARWLEARVVQACQIKGVPSHWPSLARGEKKFSENCASCHGVNGHGDGPSGGSLDPRPANFHDASRMASMTPFNIFNAIRMGVPGTGMAAYALSDDEIWDLVFYVASLRHRLLSPTHFEKPTIVLATLSERSDSELLVEMKAAAISKARTYQIPVSDKSSQFVGVAVERLREAETAFKSQNWDRAEKFALAAYLDGVELFEPTLRARDPHFVLELEQKMAAVRAAIASHSSAEDFQSALSQARGALEEARNLLKSFSPSPVMTVSLSAGIVLREALEAVLILVALLGVIRSANVPVAAVFVHLGWFLAVISGVGLWFFSGWLVALSGVQRELLEGFVTLLAVIVLLYFGFWLHRKTEIGRWRSYLGQIATQLADGKKLFGLFGVAFMAVFREAFETVLFLRALSLDSGPSSETQIATGVAIALGAAAIVAFLAIRLSQRLPVRKIFLLSSTLLVVLAISLMGKAIHAFQESGYVGISAFPFSFRFESLGIYPTWESLMPQFLIILLALAIFSYDHWQGLLKNQVPQT